MGITYRVVCRYVLQHVHYNAPFKACLGEFAQENVSSIGAPVINKIAIIKQMMKCHTNVCYLRYYSCNS
jgi:hypothetical protein